MIYFVRHGESESNIKGVFAGQREDSTLTEKGKEQAKNTAYNIKSEIPRIDRIICGPLKRARETAEIIAQNIGFDNNKIEVDNRITEYDMGSLTGTPIHKISSITLTTAKNAENPNEFRTRIYSCIKELAEKPETILVVSHAVVGRILETIKHNMEAKLFYDIHPYPNASVTKIDWIN
ncbi:histidine phosphatase family protein [Candidatus Nomurabacteria bacterium]|nr:histidine phosphatase family protein [Candidatus Nomurabacteria bacterium]